MTEKIKIALIKRNISITQLAKALNTSSQNISGKFKRDNFQEKEMRQIAEALNCDLILNLKMRDTGEEI